MSLQLEDGMRAALKSAAAFVGSTAPNPPVGACLLDERGAILLCSAHERAGTPHAEALVLSQAERSGLLDRARTLIVTLEPCNHHGRTPPCTEAILRHPQIRRLAFGAADPNPQVKGGGAAFLRARGLEVIPGILENECSQLVRTFRKRVLTGRPWVTLKAAFDESGSMIPPGNRKTFTRDSSLRFAHELRKRADAIWTGSGTILADQPLFTVRLVPDHPGKPRFLIISDRRGRVPAWWMAEARKRGLVPLLPESLDAGLDELGKLGCLEVLVECGPTLRNAWLESGLWDESVVIQRGTDQDSIRIEVRR